MSDIAQWTLADETLFLNCLIEIKAASGDGTNFKMPQFTTVSAVVDPKRTKGGPKTAKSCQNKWAAVSDKTLSFSYSILIFFTASSHFSRHPGYQRKIRMDKE